MKYWYQVPGPDIDLAKNLVEKVSFSTTHDALLVTFFQKKFEREKKHVRVVHQ